MDYTSEVIVAVARNPREALAKALRKMSSPLALTGSLRRIVLKPSVYDPARPGVTDPLLVRAAVRTFGAAGEVTLVESDNPVRDGATALRAAGYEDAVSDLDVQFVNLSERPTVEVDLGGHFLKRHHLPDIVVDRPFLVNLPTLKIDSRVTIGGAIKNLFGLLPEPDKSVYHDRLEDVLLDLLSYLRPQLTIMDLTSVVLRGTVDDEPVRVGGVMASTDVVAVDALAATLLELDPLNIPLLRRAHDMGLGEALPDRIRVLGTEHQKQRLVDAMQEIASRIFVR